MSKKAKAVEDVGVARPINVFPRVEDVPNPFLETGTKACIASLHCGECGRKLELAFAQTAKPILQHGRSVLGCVNDGKHFEMPTVTLQEVKKALF